ncbi:MAG: hypothetical protein MZU97_26085 [Bacillus subtilis]|nr:hypothetical protein [Bacillus subtilis]
MNIVVGLDGFVDEIIHAVDKRQSIDAFTRIETISDFAKLHRTRKWLVNEHRTRPDGQKARRKRSNHVQRAGDARAQNRLHWRAWRALDRRSLFADARSRDALLHREPRRTPTPSNSTTAN